MRKRIVGVIGGHFCSGETNELAERLGSALSETADTMVCGGLGGVMESACRGFRKEGKLTIGIIPGYNKEDANHFVDVVIPTGMGLARNLLVVKSADVVVALPGRSGTLSEIAYCLQFDIPVISLNSWDIPGVIKAETIPEAVEKVRETLEKQSSCEQRR
ncbi:MAG: TIGR00725 family protein [Candidatus Omnitrophota bacterium]